MQKLWDFMDVVDAAAIRAAQRESEVKIQECLNRLEGLPSPARLCEITSENKSWNGALPLESVSARYPAGKERGNVVGVDGSQYTTPKWHPVKVAYVEVMSVNVARDDRYVAEYVDLREPKAPNATGISPYDKAFDISHWRTCLELREAVWCAQNEPGTIILMDNPLLPFVNPSNEIGKRQLDTYLGIFEGVVGAPICGYISGPQSTYLSKLIQLVGYEMKYPLADYLLFLYMLGIGERSCLFQNIDWRNKELAVNGWEVYSFFIRVDEEEVVRVEVPSWVAKNKVMLDRIHATILYDLAGVGYPYCLSEAHEGCQTHPECAKIVLEEATRVFFEERGEYRISAKHQMKAKLKGGNDPDTLQLSANVEEKP